MSQPSQPEILARMPKLNLPAFEISVRTDVFSQRSEVYDPLRSKWVVLTPEEWVRQHFVHYLVNAMGYSPNRMANEIGIRLNGTLRRCDTVVYDDYMQPAMIVEYKAANIALTQRVIDQIARYNLVLTARFLVVTNGMQMYCCKSTPDASWQFIDALPPFDTVRQP